MTDYRVRTFILSSLPGHTRSGDPGEITGLSRGVAWLYHRFMLRFGYRLGYMRVNETGYGDGPWEYDIFYR